MPKPSRRYQDFVEGDFALEFASYEDMDAAARILEQWDSQIELLLKCGRELEENGRALQKYGGWNKIEGRIRETVGGQVSEHAQILIMDARTDGLSAALARSEAIVGKILQTLREGQPEEFLKFIEEHPPGDGLQVREESQERLEAAQERLAELEGGDDPEYEGERHDVERAIEFEGRVIAVMEKSKEQDNGS